MSKNIQKNKKVEMFTADKIGMMYMVNHFQLSRNDALPELNPQIIVKLMLCDFDKGIFDLELFLYESDYDYVINEQSPAFEFISQ